MNASSILASAVALVAILFGPLPAQAAQREVAITGYVSRESTQPPYQPVPISGTFQGRIDFFASKLATEVLVTDQQQVSVKKGAMNILVTMPDSLLQQHDELWYAVQLDLDGNGLDGDDWFADRGQLTASAYAIQAVSGQAAKFFQTNGGQGPITGSGIDWPEGNVAVCPFVTPAGGVVFDRMAVDASLKGNVTIGIYDQAGQRIVQVNSGSPISRVGSRWIFAVPRMYLQPSRLYYSAYSTDQELTPGMGPVLLPPVKQAGYVYTGRLDGTLPDSILPSTIINNTGNNFVIMNVALYMDEVFSDGQTAP